MESNELLALLAKMEASLNEVDSARKQVESTVNASSELQKEVGEYVSAVKALCENLQSWESDLREREGALSREYEEAIKQIGSTCTEVIKSFETEVKKTSTDFKTKTEPVIERFTEQIGKLDKHVQDLNALKDEIKKASSEIQAVKESLSQISKDLKESQDAQDEVLNDIKQKVSDISEAINIHANLILHRIDEFCQYVFNEIPALHGEINNISNNLLQVNTLCQNIKTDLQTSTNEIKSLIEKTNKETAKNITINRWIIIAGIIILVILQFLIK